MKVKKVLEIFCDVLDVEQGSLTIETTPEDLNQWDSLANLNIIFALETEFKIKFSIEDVQHCRSVNDFVLLLKDR